MSSPESHVAALSARKNVAMGNLASKHLNLEVAEIPTLRDLQWKDADTNL